MSMPSLKDKNKTIFYFGFGSNKDLAMMQHMIGKKKIKGIRGVLIGYEICIQRADQFRTDIPPTTPHAASPKDLILDTWGPKFEMYVSRPNPTGLAYGMIWELTPEDLELVREWELVDYGGQEDAWGIALDSKGKMYEVITQSFMKPPIDIDRVVKGKKYPAYIASKKAMLRRADELRELYLKQKKTTEVVK
jgi:hypothetical protein